MGQAIKHNIHFQALTMVLLICYVFSFPLFHNLNEQSADLSQIILQLQDSEQTSSPSSSNRDKAYSDSLRILKLIADINCMQVNTEDTDQDSIIVKLQTPHLLYGGNEPARPTVKRERAFVRSLSYYPITHPPDTPPPRRKIA